MNDASVASAADADRRQARALHAGARPLIALATQLRRAVLESPEGMKRALVAAVERFERELAAAGWEERSVVAASYVLCVWVDEVVAETPWGAGATTLLERFHGERDGGTRVMRLLSRLAEQPAQNQALLELFHACLSLGLTGDLRQAPDAAQRLQQLRTRLFMTLPAEADAALSPPWQPAVRPARPLWQRHAWLGALLLLGLAALAVYTTAHVRLAARVDEVFASMQQLAPRGEPARVAEPAASAQAAALRLAPLLAEDIAGRLVIVRDEEHRNIVAVPAERLFEPGSTRLSADGQALLARTAAALAGRPGKVVVIGHTDGRDARSARLPSAWHQSFEWAHEVAEALGRTPPAERLAVEGAADLDDAAQPALPRRRVDIVLHP
jgi:type VI secretion system protein ImpK